MAMMPPTPEGPPSPMPPAGGPPPGGDAQKQVEAFAEQLPEGTFSKKVVEKLVATINETAPKILGVHMPKGMKDIPTPEIADKQIIGQFPAPIAFVAYLLCSAAAEINKAYACDPGTLESDDGVHNLIAKLKAAAKDKKVLEAAKGAPAMPAKGAKKGPHMEPDEDDMGGPSDEDADNMPAPPPPGVRAAL